MRKSQTRTSMVKTCVPLTNYRALHRGLLVFLTILISASFLVMAGAAVGIDITADTSDNTEGTDGWTYVADSRTLTLNGGTWDYINATGINGLTIQLNGLNNITVGNTTVIEKSKGYAVHYGIHVGDGTLLIKNGYSGTGSLNIMIQNTSSYFRHTGIFAEENIIIESGTVEVTVAANVASAHVCGIYVENGYIRINGGEVEVTATSDGDDSVTMGICSYFGSLIISDGEVTVKSTNTGVFVDEFTISGGRIEVTVRSTDTRPCGISTSYATISGGRIEVTVASTSADINSVICGIDMGLPSTISGGEVEVTATGYDGAVIGISSPTVLRISGGEIKVTASGGDASGIYVTDHIILEGGIIKAEATATETNEWISPWATGISSYRDITISGGTVDATATAKGLFAYAFGLRSSTGNIMISDGEVSAEVVATSTTTPPENAETDNIYAYAEGISAESNSIIISGGEVKTTATSNGYRSSATGIGARNNALKISGGTVDAEATAHDAPAYGLYSAYSITIEDGIVDAKASGQSSYGIFAYTDTLTISGGKTLAIGNQAIYSADENGNIVFTVSPSLIVRATENTNGIGLERIYPTKTVISPKYKYVLVEPKGIPISGGSSVDTGSGNYAEYPRQADGIAGEIDFGTSREVKAVDLPEGVTGEVRLIVESAVKGPEGKDVRNVFEINIPNYPAGKPAVIKFELTLEEIQAKGFTGADICLYHYETETGVWTKLPTTYRVADGKVFFESVTTAFSPFAVVYEIGAATPAESDEPVVPETPVTPDADEPEVLPPIDSVEPETPNTSTPLLGMVLGGFAMFSLLRRK